MSALVDHEPNDTSRNQASESTLVDNDPPQRQGAASINWPPAPTPAPTDGFLSRIGSPVRRQLSSFVHLRSSTLVPRARSARDVRQTEPPVPDEGRLAPHGEATHTAHALRVDGFHVRDSVTLYLHGDVVADDVDHLQAVLDGLVPLAPSQLIVDVSAVGDMSLDVLRMIGRCSGALSGLVLRSPSALTCADLVDLGHSELIEPVRIDL